MSKLSYKTLLIIFFSLLIAIVALWKFVLPKQKVSAAWWNDGWNYRKAISISNAGTAQTNTQIKILDNYDLSALVTNGKLQSDLDDLRFTDINGNLLNYWIEDSTNNSVDIWCVISSLPTSGTTIYMYYGNPSATSISSTLNITIGGTMTSIGGYRVHTFNSNGTLINANNITAEVLVVAGGGGGGSSVTASGGGGGGGGGGLTYNSSYSLTKGQSINVIVGVGGTNGATNANQSGTNGGNSTFDTISTVGGGGGARVGVNGQSGGSGGGGGYNGYTTVRYGGSGIIGIGNSGGATTDLTSAAGAGGGGAGGAGGNNKPSHVGGDGGTGIPYSITGVGVTYASGGRGGGGAGAIDSPANTGKGGDGAYAANIAKSGANGIVVVRFLSGTASTPSTEEVGGGPMAYWKFDEGSGTTAYDSIGLSNGSITGATYTSEDQCVSGKCLYFNGSSYVNTNLGLGWDISTKPISISMWVKLTGTGNYYMFLSPSQGTNQRFYFGTYYGKWDMGVQNSGWGSGTIPVELNKWTHIEIIADGSTTFMYVDGKLNRQISYTSFTFPNNIAIGSHGPDGAYKWIGYVDDVKIYPYARSAAQIKQDYNSRGSLNGSSVNLGVQSSTAPSLNSKLVAYYKFDEGTGTTVYDSTTNQNNGTFGTGTSAPTWTNNGKFNKALSFNGSSNYLSTPRIPNITSNQITISAWINPNSISGTQEISNQGQWDGGPWTGWRFQLNSGHISFKLGDGTSIPYTYSAGSISTNNWQQVVGVWDGNYIYIYINGKEVGKSAKSFTYSGNSSTHWIGKYPGTGYFFNGLIDEVKIYNTALTSDEIKQDYNAGAATQFGATNQTIGGTTTNLEYCIPGDTSYCTNPIAEWKMDEKTGTTIKDISGNNNTGTFGTGSSAPTWTSGKIGAGLRFDGVDDYVSSGKDLLTSSPMTICTWFKLNTTSQDSAIIGNFASSYWTSYGKGFKYTNGTLYLMCENNNDKETISTSLNDTNWHYACGVIRISTGKLYLDGTQVASGDLNSDGYNYWTDIGAATWRNTENTKNFNGLIDHVKIYNYARTPAQIAYDYNKGAPVGWWKLDDCQGLTAFDSSGLGNNGAISIGPSGTQNSTGTCQVGTSAAWTNGAIGKYNSSLNFDGTDDYIEYLNNIPLIENMSFSFWIKFNNISGVQNILEKRTLTSNGFFIYSTDGNLVYDFGGSSDNRWYTNYHIPNNNWTHITLTRTNSNRYLYVNGQLTDSTTNIGSVANDITTTTRIGLNKTGTSYPFNGQIDDVRIYNYALTSEQVKTVYNNGAVNFN